MNFQMLQSFNESTLKQMIIDLHAENKKLKDEENKAVEEKQKEIWKLMDQVMMLEIERDSYKKSYDTIYEESKSCPQVQIVHWMDQNCIEADNVLGLDGVCLYAPTNLGTLYNNYVEWCQEEELLNRADKKTFKTEILDWQQKSKNGLSIAKSKKESDGMPNGYLSHPLINLKIV